MRYTNTNIHCNYPASLQWINRVIGFEPFLTDKLGFQKGPRISFTPGQAPIKNFQGGDFRPMRIGAEKHNHSASSDPNTGMSCRRKRPRPNPLTGDWRSKRCLWKCASLAQLNDRLDRLHQRTEATETILWQVLADADRFRKEGGDLYWLTIMRITELALLTAGAFADGCEFQAAGDLLANPVRVLIHLKNSGQPKVKRRHAALSATLRKEACPDMAFVDWFRRHVLLEVTQKALLPDLIDRLAACGLSAHNSPSAGGVEIRRFQERVAARMKAVADTIAFLSAWQLDDGADLNAKIEASSADTRRFINANLCRFKDTQFILMGAKIRSLVTDGKH
jgi:hypothetical protein